MRNPEPPAGLPVSPAERAAMDVALVAARGAGQWGDVPVGAVVLSPGGDVVGVGANRREVDADPTAHAEVVALRAAAAALASWRLEGCTMVVSLEPCVMCAGALVAARVSRLVFGAFDPKAGACGSVFDVVRDRRLNHRLEVVAGFRRQECGAVLREFFSGHRIGQ